MRLVNPMEPATALLVPKLLALVAALAVAGAWTLLRKAMNALAAGPDAWS